MDVPPLRNLFILRYYGLKNTLVYVLVSVIINSESIHPGVCTDKRRTVNATTTVVFQLYKAGFVNGQVDTLPQSQLHSLCW